MVISSDSFISTSPAVTQKHNRLAHPLPRRLFGTDGIRGKVGELLTPALALQVGYWAGQALQQEGKTGPFILGQDSRCSSDMLAMSLSAGLTAAGLEVWNVGLCPTPAVAYLTHAMNALGGVMISASHNPPADNGIKFFGPGGAKLEPTIQQEIEQSIHTHSLRHITGQTYGQQHYRPELTQSYLDALKMPFQSNPLPLQGLRVVLDLAWGAATQLAPVLFQQMGATVICLHDQPDGSRINVNCGSTHLEPLCAAVQLHNADLGFAFDGDADRVLAVDCTGRPVDGDYILYLWGKHLKQARQLPHDLIVATVMSNLGFERAWEKLGGRFFRAAVGDQYVHAAMLDNGAMLGGEQSGHILCRHYGIGGDGLQTALHMAAIVAQAGVRLCDLMDSSFQTYPQRLQNVRVEDLERRCHWQDCDALQTAIAHAESQMGNQGRVLVRASGTEPLIRVMVEAADAQLVDHWCTHLCQTVEQHLAN